MPKGYKIEVKNTLIEGKHIRAMGDAIWLYLWYLDHVTKIKDGKGVILGGKPIVNKKVATELEVPLRKIERWQARLKKHKYIETVRTPVGLSIYVTKAYKYFGRNGVKGGDKYVENPTQSGEKGTATSGGSLKSDPPYLAEGTATSGGSEPPHLADAIKTTPVDNSNDNSKYPKGYSSSSGKPLSRRAQIREDISQVVTHWKNYLGDMPADETIRSSRAHARTVLDRMKTALKKQGHPDDQATKLVKLIIDAAFADGFHADKATTMRYIANNASRIIRESKNKSLNLVEI